jgi:hypothetical protein
VRKERKLGCFFYFVENWIVCTRSVAQLEAFFLLDQFHFQKKSGIPPRVYTIEEVQALPSGTNFLWNGQISKWKK